MSRGFFTTPGITMVVTAIGLGSALQANAALFSSTTVELLYGDYQQRNDEKQGIFTITNASDFTYGDSFFFADVADVDDKDETGGIHMEFSPRFSLVRAFDGKPSDGFFKDFYLIGQLDFDANRFNQSTTVMAGVSTDLNLPGLAFFKVHVQYRDDPLFAHESVQLTVVWNAPFNIGRAKFSFEGFADWTTDEGDEDDPTFSKANLLAQPQLLWHATPNIGLGIEYQYWKNFLGIDGLDEKTPQLMLRWTF